LHTLCSTHCVPHIVFHTLCSTHYVPHIVFHTLCSHYVPHIVFHTLCSTHYVPHIMFHTLYLKHYVQLNMLPAIFFKHYDINSVTHSNRTRDIVETTCNNLTLKRCRYFLHINYRKTVHIRVLVLHMNLLLTPIQAENTNKKVKLK